MKKKEAQEHGVMARAQPGREEDIPNGAPCDWRTNTHTYAQRGAELPHEQREKKTPPAALLCSNPVERSQHAPSIMAGNGPPLRLSVRV